MRVAAAAYPLDPLPSWAAWEEKQRRWIGEADADLAVFPEYGLMELSMLAGAAVAADLAASLVAVARARPRAEDIIARLAEDAGIAVLMASGPAAPGPVNRAVLFGPTGRIGAQDKLVLTRFERELWRVTPGRGLDVFEVAGARVAVLVCYDAEFPLLARAAVERGAEVLLVPSCTDALPGYWRVRIGAMARALEGQCIAVQAPTVGAAAWCPGVDENVGAAAIYGPPDPLYLQTGVLAEGTMNAAGWVRADVDLAALARVRREGQVLNVAHWPEQAERLRDAPGCGTMAPDARAVAAPDDPAGGTA